MTVLSQGSAGRRLCAAGLSLVLALSPLRAVTLDELLTASPMTPRRFANYFEDFKYMEFVEVQDPEVFLSTETGNCQDYAILGDYVLGRRGYETHLVHVRMVGQIAHDVCYVTQSKAFLDYNLREYYHNLESSGPTVREVASKVAEMFKSNWTSASEFTYTYDEGVKHMTFTVVKTDPPSEDPDRRAP
jgi:hypothetical protein